MYCEKGVFKNFVNFTSKHLCQSFFFNEVAGSACNVIEKETLGQDFSSEFCKKNLKHLFCRTSANGCFWLLNNWQGKHYSFSLNSSERVFRRTLQKITLLYGVENYTNADFKICLYLCLHINMICRRFHIITHFNFWDMHTWAMWNVCSQRFISNRIC